LHKVLWQILVSLSPLIQSNSNEEAGKQERERGKKFWWGMYCLKKRGEIIKIAATLSTEEEAEENFQLYCKLSFVYYSNGKILLN
jgi:hypothetical protein